MSMRETGEYPKEFEEIDSYSDRLEVPGGWIVRSVASTMSSKGGRSIHTIFINDPNHDWELEEINE